jgi:16S rRNA (guanine966-N2)-methyltransferase
MVVRVVAGAYKGRRLIAPRRKATRPTQDIVREALFAMLGSVDDAHVLDLFAGSGALGIEALSRGAATATFVDSDLAAVRAVRENLARISVEQSRGMTADAEARVARAGVSVFLRAAARKGQQWSLVFCDPPYRLAHRLAEQLEELLPPVLADEARIVCESSVRQPLKLQIPLLKERHYGDTLIAIHGYSSLDENRDG